MLNPVIADDLTLISYYSRTPLFRTRLFRIPRYFELIVLSPHLKSTPLFHTCQKQSTYALLDVLLCSIAEYFYELCRILTSL